MVDYKIVKNCMWCRKRFVVSKGEAKRYYCDECQIKVNKQQSEEKK
ncbi:hypothetical protein ACFLZX_02510 [Nanoarchaeota archaeon]